MTRGARWMSLAVLALSLGACSTEFESLLGDQSGRDNGANPVLEAADTAATSPAPAIVGTGLPLKKPSWTVGEEWRYSDGYGFKVETIGENRTRFRRIDDPKQWFEMDGLFRERSQSAKALREVVFRDQNPASLYQATVGEGVTFTREYLNNGRLIRHATSWTVERLETVTVPAGTFETVVLVKRTRSLTGSWTGFERIWFSPAIRNYVRMQFRYGDKPEMFRVLTTYSINS